MCIAFIEKRASAQSLTSRSIATSGVVGFAGCRVVDKDGDVVIVVVALSETSVKTSPVVVTSVVVLVVGRVVVFCEWTVPDDNEV